MGNATTHCPYCALQCGMTLRTDSGLRVEPFDFPTNQGGLCQKGWSSAVVTSVADRLTRPLLRGEGRDLVPVSWEVALDHIAARIRDIQAEYGCDAIAVFGGGGLTNEKAYQLGKFARLALGTSKIDYNGRFCMSSAAAAANRAFGIDRGLPFPVTDLAGAGAVLLIGSNPAETMPPFVRHLDAVRCRGGLLVIDPRRTRTAALTELGSGVHLAPRPGTDLALLLGLLHIVLARDALDRDYLAQRTSGFDEVAAIAVAWWPERVEQVCGVPVADLHRVADVLIAASPRAGGSGAYVLSGRGMEQSSHGTATVTAAINLALALGLPGRRGSGFGTLTGQGNGQGGREHGQKADQLPGYRHIEDPASRKHIAGVWGVEPHTLPGKGVPAVQLLDSLGRPGGPRALLVHGANPVVSAPDAEQVSRRLRGLDLLVVADVVPSETAQLAEVVLPVTQWAEEEGTMTTLEGRIVRRRKAVDAPGAAQSELWIWAELARRLGAPSVWPTEPAAVFDELARASAGGLADYSGVSHDVLDKAQANNRGIYWPATESMLRFDLEQGDPADHLGTPRLFLDRFAHPDGRARAVVVTPREPADPVRREAPIHLITGRLLHHYQSGAQTRRVPELLEAAPAPIVELHPELARRHGITSGALVAITTARGTAYARARVSLDIRPDTVFMPFHWGGLGSANRLTAPTTDPTSGMPDFKLAAASIALVTTALPAQEVLA
ncbi:molybdopterin oxidoreductase family protein [Nostocoides veronense]|uniref:Molybdopterin oxidoreductase family protein n=1 Tax=Nostocoides veronense TaxID=330836 RepID=A0ABN2L840_9MICO